MIGDHWQTTRDGRVVIVTGGSRGTGREVALALAGSGCAVVVNYAHNQAVADAVVEEVLGQNGTAIAIRANVADELDVARLFSETVEAFGAVDVVVHAVGQLILGRVCDCDPDAVDVLTQTKVRGALLVRREAGRRLGGRGAIVNFPGCWQAKMRVDLARVVARLIPEPAGVALALEVINLPVADVDRAKSFYQSLGWRLDGDFAVGDDFRAVRFTPPGSPASITFGRGVTASEPGSVRDLMLIVDDIVAARDELIGRGVDVSEAFHHEGRPDHRAGSEYRVSGPEGKACATWASFDDPDGNGFLLQEIRRRLPGRG